MPNNLSHIFMVTQKLVLSVSYFVLMPSAFYHSSYLSKATVASA